MEKGEGHESPMRTAEGKEEARRKAGLERATTGCVADGCMVRRTANKDDASANTISPCDEDERKCAATRPARAAITCGPAHLGKPDKTRPGDEDERKCVGEADTR